MFSARTAWNLEESALTAAIRQARDAGRSLTDLTVSNPTLCGFTYEQVTLPATPIYDPDPRGLLTVREAVAAYYAAVSSTTVDPAAILLTTSTSEAYAFLFRLLADPGDQVLVAQPSYPLFDFLGDLADLQITPYPLFYDFGWWIDFAELERLITPRTRAILLVHPNNPTGHATSAAERTRLEALCARHNLALIVDEVFLDYGLGAPIESFATGPHAALTFVVSGLSKIAALPQMKIAWLTAFGPAALCGEALRRLEVISDTFLSMPAPTQLALPAWLAGRHAIQEQILTRVRLNLATLADSPAQLLPVEAGWAAVLKLPPSLDQPHLAERLAQEAGLILHPGSFYGFPGHRYLVLSLLPKQAIFQTGVEKLNNWMNLQG